MGRVCRETQELVEEQIQRPIEMEVTRLETTCRSLPWWNPLGWFCWLVAVVVRVIVFVVFTVVKWVARIVCEVVDFILDVYAFIVNLILSIPVIGGILRTIINWTSEIILRLGYLVSIVDFGLSLAGIQIPKKMHVKLIILNQADIEAGTVPLTTEAAMLPHISAAQSIYKAQCNVDLIYTGACIPTAPTPGHALTLDCGVGGFFEDWWLGGTYYEFTTATCAFEDGWRRVFGWGAEIIVFVIREVTPSTTAGCSFGPTHNYVVIEASSPECLAHEIGHACGLVWHHPNSSNLMFENCVSTATTLNRFQRALVRNSRHCTFL
jgi:hypothetical protein